MSHHEHHDHSHGPTRTAELGEISDARLIWSVVLNQVLTVGQVVAGVFSGSIALLSDAAHNFNDANALLIAYVARRVSRKSANQYYTFGYRRAELIGATINLTLLGVVGVYLTYEAISRLFQPVEILGWLMAVAAVVALIVDVATALLLWSMSFGSMNVRAAFVHNLVDALGSLAVLVGAGAIIWLGWTWVDPALTLVIAGYIIWQVATMLPQVTRILMQGAPEGLELEQLVKEIEAIEGVENLHHVHVWQLDEHHRSLEAHVVISNEQLSHLEAIKKRIKERLASRFQIAHSTLEFENSGKLSDEVHDTSVVSDH